MVDSQVILLPSDPQKELNGMTDLFGLLPKAELIKSVLTNKIMEENNVRMVALYGPWGSGKTSLMNHLSGHMGNSYETMLFEAWQLEKDSNLALSLLEQLLDLVEQEETVLKKALRQAGRTLFTFTKNLIYNITIDVAGFSAEPGKAAEKTVAELNDAYDRKSYYARVEEFKKEFRKLEEKLRKKAKKVIVFIDDLDRCEPENVLSLLSSIKLFFTYSSRILFFCGLDKNAVSAAIKTKYRDVLNHEDYLEKIFDLSFNIPEHQDLGKILQVYFPNEQEEFIRELVNFFHAIKFTTPRHVIKALNKFSLLREYKKIDASANSAFIPEINEAGNVVHVVFTMYIIILHEFFHPCYREIVNFEEKFNSYVQATRTEPTKAASDDIRDNRSYFIRLLGDMESLRVDKSTLSNGIQHPNNHNLLSLINIFAPKVSGEYSRKISDDQYGFYLNQFEQKEGHILVQFCKYLVYLHRQARAKSITEFKPFKVLDLFKMAQIYL